jgi:hypothetical protein
MLMWTELTVAEDKAQWWALVNMVLGLVPYSEASL